MPKAITKPFINRASGLRRSLERQVATVSEASPITETKMKKYFNSNETLEACDVSVSQQGNITIDPKDYNTCAMARLGVPEKTVRGRIRVEDGHILFDPYAEQSRKPTFSVQVVVGSTSLQRTIDKVKISFSVPCHLRKDLMLMYIQSEIDEVKRRLALDVYDRLVSGQQTTEEKEGGAV